MNPVLISQNISHKMNFFFQYRKKIIYSSLFPALFPLSNQSKNTFLRHFYYYPFCPLTLHLGHYSAMESSMGLFIDLIHLATMLCYVFVFLAKIKINKNFQLFKRLGRNSRNLSIIQIHSKQTNKLAR